MKKIYIIIAAIALITLIVVIIAVNFNPSLRKPEARIREDMLKLAPVGTSFEDVITLVDKKKWKVHVGNWESWSSLSDETKSRRTDAFIENKMIGVFIGEYGWGGIFGRDLVHADFHFDENLELTDVSVEKQVSLSAGFLRRWK